MKKDPRKDVGSCKSQKDVGRRKFEKYFNTKKLIGKRLAGSPRKGLLPSIIEMLFSNITVTLEISGSLVSKNERNFEKFADSSISTGIADRVTILRLNINI